MTNDVSRTRTSTGSPGPVGSAPATEAPRPWRPWWLITILAVVVSLVAGAFVQHAVDQHKAAITLYRIQVDTTVSRFLGEEEPPARPAGSAAQHLSFSAVADSISQDPGVGDSGQPDRRTSRGQHQAGTPDRLRGQRLVPARGARPSFCGISRPATTPEPAATKAPACNTARSWALAARPGSLTSAAGNSWPPAQPVTGLPALSTASSLALPSPASTSPPSSRQPPQSWVTGSGLRPSCWPALCSQPSALAPGRGT